MKNRNVATVNVPDCLICDNCTLCEFFCGIGLKNNPEKIEVTVTCGCPDIRGKKQ